MYLKYGILLLVGQIWSSSALPPCSCTRELKPVCGSDGISYSNMCIFKCVQATKPNLLALRPGHCGDNNEMPADNVNVVDVNQPEQEVDAVKVANPTEDSVDSVKVVDISTSAPAPSYPRCSCTRNYQPLCGTDGKTYNNPCLLECAQHYDGSLQEARFGRCEDYEGLGDIEYRDPCTCVRNYAPVCGSDGTTYSNPCRLRCAQVGNAGLTMVKEGSCNEPPIQVNVDVVDAVKVANPVNVEPVDPVKVADGPTFAPVPSDQSCSCTRNYEPLCGTDGKTYSNRCLLECAQYQDSTLQAARFGRCEDNQGVDEVAVRDPCACTRNFQPVCGSDGKTYSNPCMLRCSQSQNAGLQQVQEGECNQQPICACPFIYKPVCGEDGKTHDNDCIMRCARTAKAYDGPCVEDITPRSSCICTRQLRPVCGTDGNMYANPCLLNCARDYDEDLHILHEGECQGVEADQSTPAPCTCTKERRPVCGSDGVTYANECLLRCSGKQLSGTGHC